MKMAMFQPEAMSLIADGLLAVLVEEKATAIGGLELGAVPLVSAVVCRSYPDYPIDGFVVRKSVKEHGTQKKIEGRFDPRAAIVILDDVTTSGGSTLDAVQAVRDSGGSIKSCVTIVDREEGAVERLKQEGLTLRALFTKSDFQS
jgi:orotate phosphoribosyltransferase